jgi:hypothetical protein
VIHHLVDLATHYPRNPWTYQIIKNNTCINDEELLLASRLNYTVRIFLCPQVIVVKIDDAVFIKTHLACKEN